MRRHAALLLCLLILGCTPRGERDAFVDSRIPAALSPRFYPPPGWAYGLIQAGGAPAQRYGVAAPAGLVSRGDILILSDYGEGAEAWFETARWLIARGWTVWILERLGQGGSARYASLRDLGHARTLDPDIAAAGGLVERVIRPRRGVVVLGQGEGALIAMNSAARPSKVLGWILVSPRLTSPGESRNQAILRRLGLGGLRADGASAWRQDGPDAAGRGLTHDLPRGRVEMAWQRVNPDLRMGGPSLDRMQALRVAIGQIEPRLIQAPSLMIEPGRQGEDLCRLMPRCRHQILPGGEAYHLERDAERQPWLEAVNAFAEEVSRTPPA